jgi:hypothetical protein
MTLDAAGERLRQALAPACVVEMITGNEPVFTVAAAGVPRKQAAPPVISYAIRQVLTSDATAAAAVKAESFSASQAFEPRSVI